MTMVAMRPVGYVGAAAVLLMVMGNSLAQAHGDLKSTIPAADSKLKKAPEHLIINFTEPPTKDSVVRVRDGCNFNIIDEVDFENSVAHVFVSDGQPGKWKVSYDVISAADGHRTGGSYGFEVTGKAVCSPQKGLLSPKKTDQGQAPGPQAGGRGDDRGGRDDGSFPVVPIALGGAAVIALALVARRVAG